MRFKNTACVLTLGLAACVVSGAALADEEQICSDLAREANAGNLHPPKNEIYLGVHSYLLPTSSKAASGKVECLTSAGGNYCVQMKPSGKYGPGALGFLTAGGASVTYKGYYTGDTGGHTGDVITKFALCQDGKALEGKLKQLNKRVRVCMNGGQSDYGPTKPYKQGAIPGFMGLSYRKDVPLASGYASAHISFDGIMETGQSGCEDIKTKLIKSL